MKIHNQSKIILQYIIPAAVLAFISAVPCFADTETEPKLEPVMFCDFEGPGDSEKIQTFGDGVTLKTDRTFVHGGACSIMAADRRNSFSGPSVDITSLVKREKTCSVSLYAACDNPDDSFIQISMKLTDKNGESEYEELYRAENPEVLRWIKLQCEFTVPEDTENAVIYVETEDKSSGLWIDDLLIKCQADDAYDISDTIVKENGTTEFTFETDDMRGIIPSHTASVIRSDSISAEGTYSLRVFERTDSRDGISVNVSPLQRSKPFRCSSFILFSEKTHESERFSIYLEYCKNGVLFNIPVAEEYEISRGVWSNIEGLFSVPDDAENPCLVLTSVRPDDEYNYTHVSFFVDNFTVTDELKHEAAVKTAGQKRIRITVTVIAAVLLTAAAGFAVNRISVSRKKAYEDAHDSMTGVYNRNAYEKRIRFLEAHPEKCLSLFLAVCDVNNLKVINDTYGHSAGDACIAKCAGIIDSVLRHHKGKVYRTGGDEFICIAGSDFRKELSEALKKAENESGEHAFSAASGFACYNVFEDGDKPDIKTIIDRCDKEMYLNKKMSGNTKERGSTQSE